MDSFGAPICVGLNNFTIALMKTVKAKIKLSVVKGIRLEMIIFFPWLFFMLLACIGLILFIFILAIISERTIQAAIKTP